MTQDILTPSQTVGFESITQQIERRLLKRGFRFNLMVVGQSGLGKTTLINTLFASQLAQSWGRRSPKDFPTKKTTALEPISHVIQEGDVRLTLNIIDTPGFGEQVNNDKCWDIIVKYIKDQQSLYLRRELTAQREKHLQDTRVHCVLYFIQPNGYGLKPLDVAVLRKLTEIANVVPVIAKSDSLTIDERETFKAAIQSQFLEHNLRLYPYDNDEDLLPEEVEENIRIREQLPFAVVGADKTITVDGVEIRGRQNRWGVVNVEDPSHCEFTALRQFLISTHLQDLIETTAYRHYEVFRRKQLMVLKETSSSKDGSAAAAQPAAAQLPQQPQPPQQPNGVRTGSGPTSSLTGPVIVSKS